MLKIKEIVDYKWFDKDGNQILYIKELKPCDIPIRLLCKDCDDNHECKECSRYLKSLDEI